MSGYILRATSMPGQYDKKAASAVSSNRPKIRILFLGTRGREWHYRNRQELNDQSAHSTIPEAK